LFCGTIATAGILSVALLAPNALQLLKLFDGGKKRRLDPKYLIGNAFEKLVARGMLEFVTGEKGRSIRLTKSGKHKLGGMIAYSPDSRKHKHWDKRWRIVIYDIHEKRKVMRNRLQRTLSLFGFFKLQNSVWIYPFECEELIILLKADFKIGKEVLYMVVEKIEHDETLKEYFDLR
jgi:DNA-binding transcriptional regulator PaaX